VLLGLGGVLALLYLIAWVAIGRSTGEPPAILGEQRIEARGRPVPDAKWTATLRRRFPPGTDEAGMTTVLRRQGFWVDPRGRIAVYAWQEPFCRMTVMAGWKAAADGRITGIEGASAGMCL